MIDVAQNGYFPCFFTTSFLCLKKGLGALNVELGQEEKTITGINI